MSILKTKMIDLARVKTYCKDNPKLIENYDIAISDNIQTWHCHHRLETILNIRQQELINRELYYNRPASELIFLTPSEHQRLHGLKSPLKGSHVSEESKIKTRRTWKEKYDNGYINPMTGKSPFENFTPEEMKKYCEAHSVRMKNLYNEHPEIRKKISDKLTGIKRTPEQIQHYKDSYTDERRQNISKVTIETNRKHTGEKAYVYNRKWISNGVEEKLVSKSEISLFLNKGYKLGRL